MTKKQYFIIVWGCRNSSDVWNWLKIWIWYKLDIDSQNVLFGQEANTNKRPRGLKWLTS